MTKAIRFSETGGPEVLRLEIVEVGEPGPSQARVRHTYVAVNFIDIYYRTGRYPLPLPNGLGSDAVGVVEAVGPGVTDIKVGDRVGYLLGPQGAYSDVRAMPAEVLIPLPDGVSDRTTSRPAMVTYATPRPHMLAMADELFGLVLAGQIKSEPSQSFALADAAHAHRALESRATTGATVLIP